MTDLSQYLEPQTISSKITMEQKQLENMKYSNYSHSLMQIMKDEHVE